MKHLRAGAIVGSGVILGGVIWNLLGETAGLTIVLAAAVTIIVAIIDWATEKEVPE